MGLVVDLGLERYFYGDDPGRLKAIEAIVEAGHCPRLREVFFEGNVVKRVFEAKKTDDGVVTRWLDDDEVAEIAKQHTNVLGTRTSASFSWSELENVGAYDVQTLALPLADPKAWRTRVSIGEYTVDAVPIDKSIANWGDYTQATLDAYDLHRLAMDHDLIVHSE